MNPFRSIINLSVAIVVLFIAGCNKDDGNGGDQNSNTNTNTTTDGGEGFCGTVSANEVSSVLGIADLLPPEKTVVSSQTTCDYAINGKVSGVTLSYNTGMDREDFDEERTRSDSLYASVDTRDVTGVGDAAYSLSLSEGTSFETNSLWVLTGSLRFMIVSSASIDKEKQLAALIVSKL